MQHKGQIGKRYKFRNFEFWAHFGKIALLDTENIDPNLPEMDSVKFLSPKEFLQRAMAVHALIADTHRAEGKKLLDDALECVKEAKRQGDISDYKVYLDKVEKYGRPKTIYIPGPRTYSESDADFINRLRKLRKVSEEKNITTRDILIGGFSQYVEE